MPCIEHIILAQCKAILIFSLNKELWPMLEVKKKVDGSNCKLWLNSFKCDLFPVYIWLTNSVLGYVFKKNITIWAKGITKRTKQKQ